ncbi:MAG: DivIVA domain-containing protein, partial [Rhodothermales bacterium]|nr:DivIVA domain-containing protein [Rhodothermales bacterium]
MKLTPLDIRKHEFARKVRGYDPVEVRAFLEMLSEQWEGVLDELRHAQDRVREMEGKISHYEKVEEALQEALHAARESAKRTQQNAEDRARLLVEEAELKAEQVLQEAEQKRFRLRQDISQLTHRHAEAAARLRHFLMTELEILAQHEEERPVGF